MQENIKFFGYYPTINLEHVSLVQLTYKKYVQSYYININIFRDIVNQ